MVESITIRGNDGLHAPGVEAFATGAIEKNSERTGKPYWQLHLSGQPDGSGDRVYVFCDEAHAAEVANAIREVGAAVPVTVDLRIGKRGSLNVDTIKVGQ